MPSWIRPIGAALLLTISAPIAVAQSMHAYNPAAGRSSWHDGYNPVRGGGDAIPFGLASGWYRFGPNAPFQPNSFGGPNPFADPALTGNARPGMPRSGGPGGMRLGDPDPAYYSATAPPRQANPARGEELVELGDRAFRGGNYKKATERYKLASKVNFDSPVPSIHLAQVAVLHGDYATAAENLRESINASRDMQWLSNVPDIQSMYGEPAEFARLLARLESHLQTHPDDRDAWFVLGAQNYFSGRHQLATDAFLRLTDRRPDPPLSAFLRAATTALARSRQSDTDAFR